MKKLITAMCLLIMVNASSQTNKQPVTKPDTVITHAGTQTGMMLLKNDTDFEKDSLRVTSWKNGTTTYAIDKWITLTNCTIMVNGRGWFSIRPSATYIGTITTISYVINDGKHSTGVSGKILIKCQSAFPRYIQQFQEGSFYVPILMPCTQLDGVPVSMVSIGSHYYFGKIEIDTSKGYYYSGKLEYSADPRISYMCAEKMTIAGFSIIISRKDWLYMKENECIIN